MSEKTEPFEGRAGQQVLNAQAVSLMANGPLRWRSHAVVEPAAVFGQPVRGRMRVVSPAGEAIAAPAMSAFKFGARAAEVDP